MDHTMRPERRSSATWLFYGLCALAAAYVIYFHWTHLIDALPFLVVLACPLLHVFMHHGHGHGHGRHGQGEVTKQP